jgi:hypothetical protein
MSNKKSVKKSSRKKEIKTMDLHMYGIYDKKNNKLVKISLEQSEIQMEIALSGGLGKGFSECEFDIMLAI